MRYQWMSHQFARPYGDAEEIFRHFEHLRSQADLTIDSILEDAKKKNSPLHQRIEWHDATAAKRYRRQQAAMLLSRIVKVNEHGHVGRIYVSVKGESDEARHYDLVSRVMRSPKLRRPYARRALLELANWKNRYGDVPELRRTLVALEQQLQRVIKPALAQLQEE